MEKGKRHYLIYGQIFYDIDKADNMAHKYISIPGYRVQIVENGKIIFDK